MPDAALQNPIFTDENAAREALEAVRWPNGPVCPHCGSVERIAKVGGTKQSHRPGLYYCNECKGQFTVTVGSVFERSKVPLTKWWLASYLHMAGKRGVPSHQIHRTLGVTYKTAWFMMHRIREAEREGGAFAPLGGKNKVVEIDESYIGGKEANKHVSKRTPGRQGGAGKAPVLSLVERDGRVRTFHVPNVTAKTLKPIIIANVNKATYVMTDESTGDRARVLGPRNRQPQRRGICTSGVLAHQHGRKLFLDFQARHCRHVLPRQRNSPASLRR